MRRCHVCLVLADWQRGLDSRWVAPRRVYVPRCFWEVTRRKVLATEWIVGEQLAKSSPEVINQLIPVGVECFITQLLGVGFFHSDPHPGNMLVDQQGR